MTTTSRSHTSNPSAERGNGALNARDGEKTVPGRGMNPVKAAAAGTGIQQQQQRTMTNATTAGGDISVGGEGGRAGRERWR